MQAGFVPVAKTKTFLPTSMRRAGGFTLLEMLVALVLTATVATLVAQIMAQLARIEHGLDLKAGVGASLGLREVWMRESLADATPLALAGGIAFKADAQALDFSSLSSPAQEQGRPAAMRWHWLDQPQGRSIVLEDAPADTSKTVKANGSRLWQGGAASRWRFKPAEGDWLDQWPPEPGLGLQADEQDRLPELVWISAGQPDGAGMLVRIWTSPLPLASRRVVESL
jgi:prepilin-type N-terminal cleavage/methylation domain-containing protein